MEADSAVRVLRLLRFAREYIVVSNEGILDYRNSHQITPDYKPYNKAKRYNE